MIRDYFADLELEPTDDFEKVKAAYRRLARKFHPDFNLGSPEAAESFRRIQEAFEHLDSESKVRKLKKQLLEVRGYTSNIVRWKLPTKVKSRESGVKRKVAPRPDEGLDIELEVRFRDHDWKLDSEVEIPYEYLKKCPDCRGRGASVRSVTHTCKKCFGRGSLEIRRGAHHWSKTCDKCFGRGDEVLPACERCGSRGRVLVGQVVRVRPTEFDTSSRLLRLKNKGHSSFDGTIRGDLVLRLKGSP